MQLLRRHVAFMFILANRSLELKRLFARLAVAARHLASNTLTLLMMSCSKPASVVVYMYDDNSCSSCVARDCSSELAAPVSSASTSCTLSSGKIVSSVSPSHACSLLIKSALSFPVTHNRYSPLGTEVDDALSDSDSQNPF